MSTKTMQSFVTSWIETGFNATQAYLQIRPDVSYGSARTLGSRMLAKVDIEAALTDHGLSLLTCCQKISEGLEAEMANGNPDYKTRIHFHEILGKLLRVEPD